MLIQPARYALVSKHNSGLSIGTSCEEVPAAMGIYNCWKSACDGCDRCSIHQLARLFCMVLFLSWPTRWLYLRKLLGQYCPTQPILNALICTTTGGCTIVSFDLNSYCCYPRENTLLTHTSLLCVCEREAVVIAFSGWSNSPCMQSFLILVWIYYFTSKY